MWPSLNGCFPILELSNLNILNINRLLSYILAINIRMLLRSGRLLGFFPTVLADYSFFLLFFSCLLYLGAQAFCSIFIKLC